MFLRFMRWAMMLFVVMTVPAIFVYPWLVETVPGFKYYFFGSLGMAFLTGIAESSTRAWIERMYRLRVMAERTAMRRAELLDTDEPLSPVGLVRGELGDYDML